MQQHESNPDNQEPESLIREFDNYIGKGDLEPEVDQDPSNSESALEITNAEAMAVMLLK